MKKKFKRFRELSLTTKMAFSISLLFLTMFISGGFLLFRYFEGEYKKIIAKQQFELISDLAKDVDKKIEEAQTLIKMALSNTPDSVVNNQENLSLYFVKKMKDKPFLSHFFDRGLFLFNEKGGLIAEYPQNNEITEKDFSYANFFSMTVKTGKPYISKPFIYPKLTQEPIVMFTNPLFNENKELKAVLVGCVNILKNNFLGDLLNIKIGETGYVYLFDTERRIIFHPDKKRIMRQDVPFGANKLFDLAVDGFEGTDETITSRGLHAITSFKRLKNMNWIIGANFPAKEAYYPIEKAKKFFVFFIIGGIVLSLTIIILLMRGFLNPLTVLTKQTGEIGSKSGDRRLVNIKASGEILKLESSFNEMLKKLYKREEELLRLSRAVEFSSAVVIITDTEGIIEYVNPKFTEVTGYTREEVMGKKTNILKSGYKTQEEYSLLWETIKSGNVWQGIFLNKKKNGEFYWASSSISPVKDPKGNIINFVSIQDDITRIKQTEEELQKAKEMAEAASRAKSNFLASMSHEIRTPMNAIIGMSELLLDTELTPDQLKYVKIFKNAGENLLNIINDILDISKIEAGYIEIEDIGFDLVETIEKTCEIMSGKAHEKGLEFACHIHNDIPAHLIGDPLRLRQVLINLIGNAIKFTERGEVLVEVSLIKDRLEAEKAFSKDISLSQYEKTKEKQVEILFSVKDTGIGIPKDKIEGIFDKFTQVDTSTTRKYGGTGLGLAISKKLVKLMGGNLWVESELGRGSKFSFTLPFSLQEKVKEKDYEEIAELKGKKILVIDDNATNRIILTDTLNSWGVNVKEAETGFSGIKELKNAMEFGNPYDLILLDYQMPLMDGFDVAEEIRKDPSIPDIPIVMLTSDYGRQHTFRSKGLNFAAFITKPIKREELKDVISDVLSRTKKISEKGQGEIKVSKFDNTLKPLKILIAEDSEENRVLIQAYLRDTPYTMVFAKNGEEAINLFKEMPYNLILMDIQMPVKDGYVTTKEIRELERELKLTRTPIVALTAYALKDEIQKSFDAGCDAHLTKPIKKAELIEAIERYARA